MERCGFKSWSGSFPAYDPEPGLSLPWCLAFLHPKGCYKDRKYVWALSTEKILINGSDVRTAPPPGIPPEWPHSFSHPDHPDPNPSLKMPAGAAFTSRETLLIKNKTKQNKTNKKQRTGSIQKRRELGKASSHAPSCLLTLQSPAQGLTLIKPLTHISEWATKWVNGSCLNALYTGFSRILSPHQERPMLSELESDFQQKSVAGVFKDPISDFRWNYGWSQEGWDCPGNTY